MYILALCISLLLIPHTIAAPAPLQDAGSQAIGPPSIEPPLPLLQPTFNTSHPLNFTVSQPYFSVSGSGTTLKLSWVWPIRDTSLILFLDSFPNQPLDKADLLNTLAIIENRMNTHLSRYRDGWLISADDPIDEPVKNVASSESDANDQGWHVRFESNPWRGPHQQEEHLTYTTVVYVLDTWRQLINGIMGACHTFGGIQDSEWGLMGSMAATPPGAPR